MERPIIEVSGLKKVFKVREKSRGGVRGAFAALFERKYKAVTAVEQLNMEVRRGEIRGLIGPNGAGKSTTIKMISGILHPTEGTVQAMGYTPWLERAAYVRQIGVVLGQKTQLFWDLPPLDTFLLHREMYKIPESRFRENIDYFKTLLNLEDVIKRPVRNLSLGERMKCEVVCALLHNPQLVYLDEPTIGLDLFAREAIRKFIKQLNQEQQVTFILTTHDLAEIENLCDNVTIINNGTVVYDGFLGGLQSYFAQRKQVEVKYFGEVASAALNQFQVVESRPGTVKIEIDLARHNLQDEVYRIFSALPVQDINIEGVGIEAVIRQIYSQSS